MKGILGIKIGMTQVFTTSGKLIPITVVVAEPNVVTQIKTRKKDGYEAVQLGFLAKRDKLSNKPERGHFKKTKTLPKRFLREIRDIDIALYPLGKEIKVNLFEVGEVVDVTGTSKGKGFQGVIKRHNFKRGPMTHGSRYHRRVGSLGSVGAMRVLKGKKLPGQMGGETTTIQNLKIVAIDQDNNCLLIKGSIPGPNKSLVIIKTSVKKPKSKIEMEELVSYQVFLDDLSQEDKNNAKEVSLEFEEVKADEPIKEEIVDDLIIEDNNSATEASLEGADAKEEKPLDEEATLKAQD